MNVAWRIHRADLDPPPRTRGQALPGRQRSCVGGSRPAGDDQVTPHRNRLRVRGDSTRPAAVALYSVPLPLRSRERTVRDDVHRLPARSAAVTAHSPHRSPAAAGWSKRSGAARAGHDSPTQGLNVEPERNTIAEVNGAARWNHG